MNKASTVLLLVALAIVGAALYLLSLSTAHSETFGQWHLWLIAANIVVALGLITVIALNIWRLVHALRRSRTGARLTVRLVVLFTALAMLPVGAVFYFSVQFINRSIDSWFTLNVGSALNDALVLSREALAGETGPYAGASAQAARMLANRGPEPLGTALNRLRRQLGADALGVYASDGRPVEASMAGTSAVPLAVPASGMAAKLVQHGSQVELFSHGGDGLYVRVFAPMRTVGGRYRVLEAQYKVAGQSSVLARRVEAAYSRYQELQYMRQPLKTSFTLTLSLVLLLSLLAAIWAAFFAARRVAEPVRELARAAQAVGHGDFKVRVPEKNRDEIGFLAQAFNDMTEHLARTRAAADRGQRALEAERTWLATVLGALSAGVVTRDAQGNLRSINAAATRMLGLEPGRWVGRSLDQLLQAHPEFAALLRSESPQSGSLYDVRVLLPAGDRTLRAGYTELGAGTSTPSAGCVWIFEDVTEFVMAQRKAAWGEVARRLAHEIKNPLTPIQLAAERLRRRCLGALKGREAEILDRGTATIVSQVQAMLAMVDAFSAYAKSPPLAFSEVDLSALLREVADLYRGRADLQLEVTTSPRLEPITADSARLRQILHNLIKNAIEAQEDRPGPIRVLLVAGPAGEDPQTVALCVQDEGPGFAPQLLAHAFEPYVSGKARGTGLGLALVRKLAEEHGGTVSLHNLSRGGAEVRVTLPRRRPSLKLLQGGVS
ncbi:MAG: ATP-binding protein [Gammaproteobacteria bacterium]|nr:ATP-binding protein [Gammaproteobacteria bacterium]